MRNKSSIALLVALAGLVFCPAAQAQVTESTWSGYLLKSPDLTASKPPTSFSTVGAHWIQPAVGCNGGNGRVSFWVGFDGGAAGSVTVEQAGTFVRCMPGKKPLYTAFWQMVSRANGSGDQPFEVAPGDAIEAAVTYANGLFTLEVADVTSHHAPLLKSIACADDPICKRGTAEWIVERPGGGTYPLADYGSVFFDKVGATSVGAYPQEEVISMVPKGTKQMLSTCSAAPRPPLPRETEVATVEHPRIDLYNSFQCQWLAP
jgi:Peptidase A4 family